MLKNFHGRLPASFFPKNGKVWVISYSIIVTQLRPGGRGFVEVLYILGQNNSYRQPYDKTLPDNTTQTISFV